jgi:5-hydroxyisourate hydrolase
MGRLSTHVLDTARGMPAAGMLIELFHGSAAGGANEGKPVRSAVTNADGRTDSPLLEGAELLKGSWRLVFHVGDYYRGKKHPDAGCFLEDVPVDFIVEDPSARYHVPLLVSPWSYSTYRGS